MDPIADMLTIIRNAQAVEKETVRIPYSEVKMNLAKILEKEGYVASVEKKERKTKGMPVISIKLKYANGTGAIAGIKRISTPGQRLYVKSTEIKLVKGGYGKGILSTPKGLMTEQEARKQKLGGEYMCEVW